MDELINLLSDSEKASTVIYNIASYVIYIYPGIISIYVYNFFNARKTHTTQAFIIKSFAISYLYNVIMGKVCPAIKIGVNGIRYNLMLIVISFAIPYGLYRFKNSDIFARICALFKIGTSVTEVPFELLGDKEENYTCLKVYLKDIPYIYIGYVSEYEYESESDKYVILSGYKKYLVTKTSEEKILVDNESSQCNEKVYIKLADIKLIEKIAEERANKEIFK